MCVVAAVDDNDGRAVTAHHFTFPNCKVSLNPPTDGNCLFSAISDQMKVCLGKDISAAALRRDITDYLLERHGSLTLLDSSVVHLSEKLLHSDVPSYLHNMRQPGTFGDHIMILGACCLLSVQFVILSTLGEDATVVVAPNKNSHLLSNLPTMLLGHYAEDHGEHYVSLTANSKQRPLLESVTSCPELVQAGRVASSDDSLSHKCSNVQPPNFHQDIGNVRHYSTICDDLKYNLIKNREPDSTVIFPARHYKDKRAKSGLTSRYCCRDWFKMFPFVSYSMSAEGLFCLPCVLFPDSAHRRPKKLITDAYQNWKDAVEDMKQHATCDYHMNSAAKMNAFMKTYEDPSSRIDVSVTDSSCKRVQQNRDILTSVVKCLQFCGRQGIALRGHRDDDTSCSLNKGNFKELLQFRVDAGDKILEEHMQTCAKNATYTSKTSQNDLLLCVKEYIQSVIVQDVKKQAIGPYYGFQCDEVTDVSNYEQLGIVIRYVKEYKPVERLLEFVPCENISGKDLCENIIKSQQSCGLDIRFCRTMTMDGAGNMAGKQAGCAARFTEQSPKALYHYCSSHDLNLALCKSCSVREIPAMLDTITQLGISFKYSPKRSRRLEKAITEENKNSENEQLTKRKIGLFCETRWTEKHTTLSNVEEMYLPILACLDAIASVEGNWDSKTSTAAYGLLKSVTDHVFILAFQVVLHFFRYIKGLSTKLQGSTLDVIQGYDMVTCD